MARRLKPEETDLWNRVAAGVQPLKPNKRSKMTDGGHPEPETKPKTRSSVRYRTTMPNKVMSEPLIRDRNPDADIDKRTLDRLKKGKMTIEARLDLHGHTQNDAHRALDAFIAAAHDAGRRCVLVITGKGLRGEEGRRGVLREKVPQWLSGGRLGPMIISWQPAQPRDGGEGALYVLIRRRR